MFRQIKMKLFSAAKRVLPMRSLVELRKREDGLAAVEFAMVAAPFLALMFAIIETCFIFFAGQTLENATADASRLILTGQAQTQGFSQTQFKQAVCARVFAMFDCQNKLIVDVRTSASFGSTDMTKPINAQGNLQNNQVYQPGNAGDIVVVRVMYAWPVYVSLLGVSTSLSDMAGSTRLLLATAAFRNEPYQ